MAAAAGAAIQGTNIMLFPPSAKLLVFTLGPVVTRLLMARLHDRVTLHNALPPPIPQTLSYRRIRVNSMV